MYKFNLFALVALAGVLLGVQVGFERLRLILAVLATGWFEFLRDVARNIEVRWDGIAMFVVALSILSWMAHGFSRWLYRESISQEVHDRAWRPRWTATVISGVVLMFTIGIAMVGLAHHLIWIFTAKEPLFTNHADISWMSDYRGLRAIGIAVAEHLGEFGDVPNRGQVEPGQHKHGWPTKILGSLNYRYSVDDKLGYIDPKLPWDHPKNAPHFRAIIPDYLNAELIGAPFRDSQGYGLNHYAGNTHVFERDTPLPAARLKTAGSALMLIGEVNSRFVPWGHANNCRDPLEGIHTVNGFGGAPSAVGAKFLMADGSVRMVHRQTDDKALQAMAVPRITTSERED